MTLGSNKLHFTYDSLGPASVTYNGVKYFYLKNAQGDVTGLVNASGTQVVSYTYDPWGAPMSVSGSMSATLGAANPLRYRGYVYDSETGLYTELPMNGFGFSASSLIGFSFEVCRDDD